jgi:hypothetical protein
MIDYRFKYGLMKMRTSKINSESEQDMEPFARYVSCAQRTDKLWGQHILLSNGYQGPSFRRKAAGAWS